jgi:hypothetical protein
MVMALGVLLTTMNDSISFSAKERLGVEYHKPLRDLLGRVARGAKHAETARVADRRHHGRVVREAEYGLSDAKAFAKAVL